MDDIYHRHEWQPGPVVEWEVTKFGLRTSNYFGQPIRRVARKVLILCRCGDHLIIEDLGEMTGDDAEGTT